MEALFPLGQIVATPGEFLYRHAAGDWGKLDAHDVAENLYGLKHGFRVLSSYRTNAGDTLWLITEADRASAILLPQEY